MSQDNEPENKELFEESTADKTEPDQAQDNAEDVIKQTTDDAETAEPTENSEVAELKEQLEQKEDQVLRLSAEIKNMQRRAANERQQAAKFRAQSLATALLPVIDSLEKALEVEVTDEAGQSLKDGVEIVHKNFLNALTKEGIEVLDPVGEPFDPTVHQSVSSVAATDEHPADTVTEVYQKGYVLNGRVLRPAMVIVAQ